MTISQPPGSIRALCLQAAVEEPADRQSVPSLTTSLLPGLEHQIKAAGKVGVGCRGMDPVFRARVEMVVGWGLWLFEQTASPNKCGQVSTVVTEVAGGGEENGEGGKRERGGLQSLKPLTLCRNPYSTPMFK